MENAIFIIEVDDDGRCSWSLVDQAGEVVEESDGFTSVEDCRDSVEAYKAARAALADAEVQERHKNVPNI